MSVDTRIAYGSQCTWWDSIQKVGNSGGIPCCPHCKGLLFEAENEKQWLDGAAEYEKSKNKPGYKALIEWARGKCFPDLEVMRKEYAAQQPKSN